MEEPKTNPEALDPDPQGSVTRLHKYITKNSEYVIAGDRCVAVRKRGLPPGQSEPSESLPHAQLPQLRALVRWGSDGKPNVLCGRSPRVGDSLLLGDEGAEVMTSVIRRVETLPGSEASPQ